MFICPFSCALSLFRSMGFHWIWRIYYISIRLQIRFLCFVLFFSFYCVFQIHFYWIAAAVESFALAHWSIITSIKSQWIINFRTTKIESVISLILLWPRLHSMHKMQKTKKNMCAPNIILQYKGARDKMMTNSHKKRQTRLVRAQIRADWLRKRPSATTIEYRNWGHQTTISNVKRHFAWNVEHSKKHQALKLIAYSQSKLQNVQRDTITIPSLLYEWNKCGLYANQNTQTLYQCSTSKVK